jgi:hypothetical protein
MDLRRIFQKKPKALDAGGGEDASPLGDAIAANEVTRKKQMLLLGSAGAAALVAGSLYIFDDSGKASDAEVRQAAEGVSVDELVNKNMAEKEWRAQSEAQMMSMDNNMRALASRAERADQLEQQLAAAQGAGGGQGGAISSDTERVLSAYQTENEQLRAALNAARQSPVGASAGPNALYGRTSPPSYQVGRRSAGWRTAAHDTRRTGGGLSSRPSSDARQRSEPGFVQRRRERDRHACAQGQYGLYRQRKLSAAQFDRGRQGDRRGRCQCRGREPDRSACRWCCASPDRRARSTKTAGCSRPISLAASSTARRAAISPRRRSTSSSSA